MADNIQEINRQIGKLIKMKRSMLGLSQRELAEKLGYSTKGSIQRIEAGAGIVPPKRAKDFADILKLPPDKFLSIGYNTAPSDEDLNDIIAESFQTGKKEYESRNIRPSYGVNETKGTYGGIRPEVRLSSDEPSPFVIPPLSYTADSILFENIDIPYGAAMIFSIRKPKDGDMVLYAKSESEIHIGYIKYEQGRTIAKISNMDLLQDDIVLCYPDQITLAVCVAYTKVVENLHEKRRKEAVRTW